MYAVSASHELSAPAEQLRVTIVTVAAAEHARPILTELRREGVEVTVADLDLEASPRGATVHVVSLDAQTAAVLGSRIVEWVSGVDPSPGLIGVLADGSTEDVEELLAAGFDDVVVIPASMRELVSRVRAVHRRVHWKGQSNGRLRFDDLTLDLHGRALWLGEKTVTLTTIELAVLRELFKARGKPRSRAELLDAAWGSGELDVSERAVDNVILRLRRKLPPELIETVRSVGFRLSDRRRGP